MTRPTIIGLTGSIGMGKSTVAAMFAEAGIPVFDADAEVRAMQGPGGELVPAIEAAFPGSTGPDGVDRERLGHQVFADKDALARLEAIVHPAVAARRAAFLERHHEPEDVQRARVLARPGMTKQKFDHIFNLQLHDTHKRTRADHVIDTGTTRENTRAQVMALIASL
ncbi:MAG: dephospho-CoA kinase [Alphaproteobacteria bacterium HGW-Alphaproteobacteria-14]|nr:MAG: dephospho-CoA kinase [Alphaproteobacteria bacterium HGW-Alphaproteobacteria-14]